MASSAVKQNTKTGASAFFHRLEYTVHHKSVLLVGQIRFYSCLYQKMIYMFNTIRYKKYLWHTIWMNTYMQPNIIQRNPIDKKAFYYTSMHIAGRTSVNFCEHVSQLEYINSSSGFGICTGIGANVHLWSISFLPAPKNQEKILVAGYIRGFTTKNLPAMHSTWLNSCLRFKSVDLTKTSPFSMGLVV